LGVFDFKVASWGLMNPGIEIRFDTTRLVNKNARRAWRATASILIDFAGNSNNLRT
jgi:hypothetical protein